MRWLLFVLTKSRGVRNMVRRLPTLIDRFGLDARKIVRQLNILLAVTDKYDVHPTLPVTAVTARRHPDILRWLAARGVELAAHGYVHNDYSALSLKEQKTHVHKARRELMAIGLEVRGWRCPYSRWNDDTLTAVQAAGFDYEATPVYAWPAYTEEGIALSAPTAADYERVCRLFGARNVVKGCVLPSMCDGLVQIPMSIPEDEDMVDRLHLDATTMSRVWRRMLHDSYDRREILVLSLHPERASLCAKPLEDVLAEARSLGDVWFARLGEIADWWQKRDRAAVAVTSDGVGKWQVFVDGPDQLAWGFGAEQRGTGPGSFGLESATKPVVQCGPAWSDAVRQRLRDAGYPVENGATAADNYALNLDEELATATEADAVVRFVIDRTDRVLRLYPWPSPYRSCLSVTGDIDALTLIDFAMRLREF